MDVVFNLKRTSIKTKQSAFIIIVIMIIITIIFLYIFLLFMITQTTRPLCIKMWKVTNKLRNGTKYLHCLSLLVQFFTHNLVQWNAFCTSWLKEKNNKSSFFSITLF